MRILKKIWLSAITLMLALILSINCSAVPFVYASNTMVTYTGYDISELNNLITEFNKQCRIHNNTDNVVSLCSKLIEEGDILDTQYQLACIAYYKNVSDTDLKDEYLRMSDIRITGFNQIYNAFQKALNVEEYQNILKEKLGNIIYIISQDSSDFGAETARKREELQNRYFEVLSSNKTESEKRLECAEIYLETAKFLNSFTPEGFNSYIDYVYLGYSRDYSVSDIKNISDNIKKDIVNSYRNIEKILLKSPEYSTFNSGDYTYDNNFEIIKKYAGRISEELEESADFITENELYTFGKYGTSRSMAFTTSLSQYKTAYIYQCLYGTVDDLISSIHEFGHFNSIRLNTISALCPSANNLDIAEVQSQGLEVMYTDFYDEIFGDYSDIIKMLEFLSILRDITGGFMVNEFECYVFENADTMTAQDVIDKYTEIKSEYNNIYGVDFYRIQHIYMYPGYYISYASSALAVMSLWGTLQDSFDKAAELYTAFSHYSYIEPVCSYTQALRLSGFEDNIFSDEFISDKISQIAEKLIYGSEYLNCDIDGNGIVKQTDLVILKQAVLGLADISSVQRRRCDINSDGAINAADVIQWIKAVIE